MSPIGELNLVPGCEAFIAIGTFVQACMERQPIEALGMVVAHERKTIKKQDALVEHFWQWPIARWRRRSLRRAIFPEHERAKWSAPGSAELARDLSEIFDHGLGGKSLKRNPNWFYQRFNRQPRTRYFPTREAVNDSDSRLGAWGFLTLGTSMVVIAECLAAATTTPHSQDELNAAICAVLLLFFGLVGVEVWNSLTIHALTRCYEETIAEADISVTEVLRTADARKKAAVDDENAENKELKPFDEGGSSVIEVAKEEQ